MFRNLCLWTVSVLIGFFCLAASPALAYQIDSFETKIEINRDTSLRITERIEAVFTTPAHGIIRTLPVIYRSEAKNINSRISAVSVTDETGRPYKFSLSRSGDNLDLKIGDPGREIAGLQVYLVSYTAKNILQRYTGYDELYWNAVGSDWDVPIASATAIVVSPHARVTKSDCFGSCHISPVGANTWQMTAIRPVSPGSDLTFVLGFDPENQLLFPNPWFVYLQDEGIWMLLAISPAVIMAVAWWRRGRDYRYSGSNPYYRQADALVERANPFARDHLPLVYSPITGLTPSEAGTILDLQVDLADVVAEITELARLGFITIHQIRIDRPLLPDTADYIFVRTKKADTGSLKEHQKHLLDSLFNPAYLPKLSFLEKILAPQEIVDPKAGQLSKMSGHFYSDLNRFREKLYRGLTEEEYFGGRPDHLRAGGLFAGLILTVISSFSVIIANMSGSGRSLWPWVLVSGMVAMLFGYRMGFRTAAGHALYRQLTGLKYFLGKGKWRYDIAEKHLFLEEILPLAISLGVVSKLSRDMQELQIQPPKYFGSMSYADLGRFSSGVGRSLATGPGGSSGSSRGWSGRSGFSGGRTGGGFGGGGGRSW